MKKFSNQSAISAIVCTWNPGDRIDETLTSLANQSSGKENLEVIIVDNASDSPHCQRLKSQCDNLGFKYVYENTPGLSHARNRGIEEAGSGLVFFIDDDAVAPAHLITKYLEIFEDHPEIAVAGGPAHGLWEDTPPRWLASRYWRMLSLVSYGSEARNLAYPNIVIGCNITFRKSVFEKYGVFDTKYGRKKDGLEGNEERVLLKTIMDAGEKVYYEPHAYVFHKVPESRMTRKYFSERAHGGVISKLKMSGVGQKQIYREIIKIILWSSMLIPYRGFKMAAQIIYLEASMAIAAVRARLIYVDSKKQRNKTHGSSRIDTS